MFQFILPTLISLLETSALAQELLWVRTAVARLKTFSNVNDLVLLFKDMSENPLEIDSNLKDKTVPGESTLFVIHALSVLKRLNQRAELEQFDLNRLISFAKLIVSSPKLRFAHANTVDKTRAYLKVLQESILHSFPDQYDAIVAMDEESRKTYFTADSMRKVVSENLYAGVIRRIYMYDVDGRDPHTADPNAMEPSAIAASHLIEILKHNNSSLGEFLISYVTDAQANGKKINHSQTILSSLVGFLKQHLTYSSGVITFPVGTPFSISTSVLPPMNIHPHKPVSDKSQGMTMIKSDVDAYAREVENYNRAYKKSTKVIQLTPQETADEAATFGKAKSSSYGKASPVDTKKKKNKDN